MQDIKQNLADAVREARTKLGLSQEQLAEILGFDSRTILNIENGRGGLSTLFQTNFFRLFFRYCTGV
jgi:ribosome-binding protein aMBF1 (putative translation factor)